MSTDLHTLSGAYALHALSSEEAEEFQKHLDACPACRQEVKEPSRPRPRWVPARRSARRPTSRPA